MGRLRSLQRGVLTRVRYRMDRILNDNLFFFHGSRNEDATIRRIRVKQRDRLSISSRPRQILSMPFTCHRQQIIRRNYTSSCRSNFLFNPRLIGHRNKREDKGTCHISIFAPSIRGAINQLYPFRNSMEALFRVRYRRDAGRFPTFFFRCASHRFGTNVPRLLSSSSNCREGQIRATCCCSQGPFPCSWINAKEDFPVIEAKFWTRVGNNVLRRAFVFS